MSSSGLAFQFEANYLWNVSRAAYEWSMMSTLVGQPEPIVPLVPQSRDGCVLQQGWTCGRLVDLLLDDIELFGDEQVAMREMKLGNGCTARGLF